MPTTFFNMSLSILTFASSIRNRCSSFSSAVSCLLPLPLAIEQVRVDSQFLGNLPEFFEAMEFPVPKGRIDTGIGYVDGPLDQRVLWPQGHGGHHRSVVRGGKCRKLFVKERLVLIGLVDRRFKVVRNNAGRDTPKKVETVLGAV